MMLQLKQKYVKDDIMTLLLIENISSAVDMLMSVS